MPLITLENISIRFRGPSLLEEVSGVIEPGQRIGLLGRNGAGKTTLLRILAGDLSPDNGQVIWGPGVKVARLVQDVPDAFENDESLTIADVILSGLAQQDELADWERERNLDKTLNQLELDGSIQFTRLSSGLKRRALLGKAIVAEPDILLLDEPTNHLDIDSIRALEDFLLRWPKTLIFITHDRTFLQKLATRIWEVDRGRLFDWSCDYPTFLKRKEEVLLAEEKQQALFDKKLAQEEAWIRQGIKARRTRNEGRVRALEKMRRQHAERRTATGLAKLDIQEANRSGALVAKLEDVSFSRGERKIVEHFSTTIMRGDKIGIIGRNGAGKTTLLKLMLGELQPDSGSVRLGTNLQIAYFDQLRDQLDDEKSVQDNVAEDSDRVMINGNSRHVIGYLQDFLFTAERARTPVKFLSGGERNRVLLAKLMTKPANVFVLDEPTNDLDSETLELLENQLVDFQGTLLVVSHDRTFLNNVVTSTIVFEDDGVNEYVGGYDAWWESHQRRLASAKSAPTPAPKNADPASEKSGRPSANSAPNPTSDSKRESGKKLNYKEQKELENLPDRIEVLESQIAQMHEAMADADFYRREPNLIAQDQSALESLTSELATAYERWEELESRTA